MAAARTKVEGQANATTTLVWCAESILKGTEHRTTADFLVSRPGTRTRDPLIKSESADLRTAMHDEVNARDSEGR
jgi:hypothetical protein